MVQRNLEENAFFQRVRALVHLGVVPEVEDEVEVSFVDVLARSIRLLFCCEELLNETFQILNPHSIRLSQLLSAPELGLGVRPVSLATFIDRLRSGQSNVDARGHVQSFLLHSGWMGLLAAQPGSAADTTPFTILSERTQQLLERLGLSWPVPRPETLRRMAEATGSSGRGIVISSRTCSGTEESA
jgi:phthiocerol/phenolphthiocerol synthesis type-I polyketide synthase E